LQARQKRAFSFPESRKLARCPLFLPDWLQNLDRRPIFRSPTIRHTAHRLGPMFYLVYSITRKEKNMFWTIIVVLFVLWLLGLTGGFLGDFVHVLLLIALAMVAIRLIRGGTSAV
jgi:hypothetical protein